MMVRHLARVRGCRSGPGAVSHPLSLAPDELFRARRRRGGGQRIVRRLRRAGAVAVAMATLGAITFAALFLITPATGNAWKLVRAQDRAHHAAYPGPQVPHRFAVSLIATYDHRSYPEFGMDPLAIARVSLARLTGGGQGGGSISRQLARLLYAPAGWGLAGQVEQAVLGIKLNLSYTRAQILQMYADVAYFGHGFYGLAAASCGYFGQLPSRLSWAQSAMLAGLAQAPAAGYPVSPARARARAAHVLGQLVATHALTRAQATAAVKRLPPRLTARSARDCRSSR
jgi:membrane peptidoglycan carboxypeptidase